MRNDLASQSVGGFLRQLRMCSTDRKATPQGPLREKRHEPSGAESVMSFASPYVLGSVGRERPCDYCSLLAAFGIFAARRPLGVRLTYARLHADLVRGSPVWRSSPCSRRTHGSSPSRFPLGLPLGRTLLGFDPLSAAFAVIVNVATAIVSGYAIGYGAHAREPQRVVPFYPAFIAGMNLVLLAQDAFSFLIGWEFMSLASWALVVSEHGSSENRRAALLYLIMATGGALTLLLAFGLLAGPEGGYAFEAIRRASAPGVGAIVLILALVGAGSKAGLVPLHAWLPLAHPAAPSHVSALMSGVMTKVAVYGFVRLVFDLAGPPAWWWSVPVLVDRRHHGSAGCSLCVDGTRFEAPARVPHGREHRDHLHRSRTCARVRGERVCAVAAALALAAAIFHVFNHSLFKSLLFMGSGAVLNATGERDMEHLGGLIHRMPVTARGIPRRMHRHFRAAALQRLRLRVAHVSGHSPEPATAAVGSETPGSCHRRDARLLGSARGGLLRQSLRHDVSGPATLRCGNNRARDGSLVPKRHAGARGAVSPRRNPAGLRHRQPLPR